jgi:hypothetical protein
MIACRFGIDCDVEGKARAMPALALTTLVLARRLLSM